MKELLKQMRAYNDQGYDVLASAMEDIYNEYNLESFLVHYSESALIYRPKYYLVIDEKSFNPENKNKALKPVLLGGYERFGKAKYLLNHTELCEYDKKIFDKNKVTFVEVNIENYVREKRNDKIKQILK